MKDLSDTNRRILMALKDVNCANRRHISELTALSPNRVSPALNRLEAMGFVDRPATIGGGWTITAAGYALYGFNPPNQTTAESTQTAVVMYPLSTIIDTQEPEPEPELAPVIAPIPGPYAAGKSAEIMGAMEAELALEQVRGRLLHPVITARPPDFTGRFWKSYRRCSPTNCARSPPWWTRMDDPVEAFDCLCGAVLKPPCCGIPTCTYEHHGLLKCPECGGEFYARWQRMKPTRLVIHTNDGGEPA